MKTIRAVVLSTPTKIRRLTILLLLVLTGWAGSALAQPDQRTFTAFSWEGLSMSMTAAQMKSALEDQGYKPFNINENERARKIVAVYNRKTATAANKVQFIEKNGALTRLSFSETRLGIKNQLTVQAADEIYARIRTELAIEDSACRAGVKGGGTCVAQLSTSTHDNSFNVNVNTRFVKLLLLSQPLPQSVVETHQQTATILESAYACFGPTDITSVRDIYDCIQSSSNKLANLPPRGSDRTHRPLQLDYPTLTCANVADYYRQGLSFTSSDPSAIPDCGTLAAVVERATGKPPYWSACVDPSDDAESFKNCVGGYSPSLVRGNSLYLPSCEKVQRSYKIGVLAGQPDSKFRDVAVPDCDYVRVQANSWRGELPEGLRACGGYDPDKTAEHLMKCLSSERDFLRLQDCRGVQIAYERNVTIANGYRPDTFYALPCDQAQPLLAKAEEARERKRREAEELARQLAEAKARAAKARQDHVNAVNQKMAEKYADTAEGVASRTSALEKQIRAGGGGLPGSCSSPRSTDFYCPPTAEEVRLAMMRRHVQKSGFKMVNGHLLHGKQPTIATVFLAIGGQSGEAMLGLELHYREAELVYACDRRSNYYECRFKLPIKTNYDELTKMYMDGLTAGSAFNFNDFMFNLMDSALAVEYYSFKFRLDNAGLWRAEPTLQQEIEDLREEVQSLR
jgi:hypothetical protein